MIDSTRRIASCIAMLAAACAPAAWSQVLPSLGARAVPTYESVGLYWTAPGATLAGGCEVTYRRTGAGPWLAALPLWFDARNNECRGSLVHLLPDTEYEVRLGLPGVAPVRQLTFRTWPNQRPVALTVPVASGSATLNITAGGTPLGWVVYEGVHGAVLDAQNAVAHNVTINASYVIVRRLILRGAQQDAIRISPNVTDVIIEDNEITGWGRQRTGIYGVEHDSAVRAVCSTPTLERVTVQRNEIHDPRYTANSWSDGHPQGPQGVTFYNCGGNHVIRHNEIFSTTGRYYNDIIGGGPNNGLTGFPNADTDIYGNELSHAWDDAIEAEGGNRNVRIWGNYIDRTGTGIASTPTGTGPIYLFRNVYNRGRLLGAVPPDSDDRQVMFKAGADPLLGDGRRYILHNTTLQARESAVTHGLGASGGISGIGTTRPVNNTVSRNNIFHNWRTWTAYFDVGTGNDFGWDLMNGSPGAPATHSIAATPVYAPGHGWQSEAGGNYQLAVGAPGYDAGARIANFNDAFTGGAPDVGAHEGGTPPMRFGIAASPGSATGALASDVSIALSADPNPASVGKDMIVTLTAANHSATAATGVVVNTSFPTDAVLIWASQGCATSGATVTCSVGTLAAGASVSLRVVARPSSPGTAASVATITSAEADLAPTNNSRSISVPVNPTPAPNQRLRYRLYSPITQEHLFTTDQYEYNVLGEQGWVQEGTVGKVLDNPGSFRGVPATAYYRLYDNNTRWHHWTTDANEYYTLVQFPHWTGEGVDGYILTAPAAGATQLFRLVYPDGRGLHHWTIDAYEYETLISTYGWVGEGGSGYVIL